MTATPERRPSRAAGPVLLGALAGALFAGRFETGLFCLACAVTGGLLAHARRPAAAALRALAIGCAIALVLNVLLVHGAPLLLPPFVRWGTRDGLAAGALLALRLVGAAAALHGLRFAWPGEHAADELAGRVRWLETLRVPVRTTRAVVGLALRFAPLVAAEAARIATLQDHRAGGPPRSRSQWVQRRRALMVPLLVCTLERAERVALGMEARHYRVRPVARLVRAWPAEVAGLLIVGVSLAWRA